jgi:hypothetical protein
MLDPQPSSEPAVQLDSGQIYHQSWQIFSKHWKFIIVVGVATTTLTYLINRFAQLLAPQGLSGVWIGYFFNLVISNVIALGWIRNYLSMGRGSQPTVDEFTKLDKLPIYVLGTLALGLLILSGLLFFIVPGIYFAVRYQFLPTLLTDKNISISKGFALAGKMTQGQVKNLSLMVLCNLVLLAAGFMTFGIGLIVAVPLTTIAGTIVYLQLVSKLSPADLAS